MKQKILDFLDDIKKSQRDKRQIRTWYKNNYSSPAPQIVKQFVMNRYAIPDAEWIETGTYRGTTTNYLSRHFPHVHTIEPQLDFYESVKLKFKEKNITVYHGTSEDILPGLLPKVNRVLNFWLDGHYSGGETFQGKNECPIEIELREIERNKYDPQNLTVFIDDVRCFASRTEYLSYPDLDFLTGWAARNGLNWIVEHDILVLKKF